MGVLGSKLILMGGVKQNSYCGLTIYALETDPSQVIHMYKNQKEEKESFKQKEIEQAMKSKMRGFMKQHQYSSKIKKKQIMAIKAIQNLSDAKDLGAVRSENEVQRNIEFLETVKNIQLFQEEDDYDLKKLKKQEKKGFLSLKEKIKKKERSVGFILPSNPMPNRSLS